jgi:hypothetical protein
MDPRWIQDGKFFCRPQTDNSKFHAGSFWPWAKSGSFSLEIVGPESNLKVSSRKLLASSQEMIAFGPETFGLVPFTLAKEIAKFYSGKEIERGIKTQTCESRLNTQTNEPTTCQEPTRAGDAYVQKP